MHILVNYTGRTGGGTGGGADYAYKMTRELCKLGLDVSAIVSKQADNLSDWQSLPLRKLVQIDTYTNKWQFLYRSVWFKLRTRRSLKLAFYDEKIDYLYVPMITYWSYWINDIFPHVKQILTLHDPVVHSGESRINRRLFMNVQRIITADKLIILSECFRDFTEKTYKKKSDDVLTIPLPSIDIPTGSRNIGIRYDDNKINFLFYGRIEAYKGLHVLAAAYRKVTQKYNNVALTVAGSGDFSDYQADFDTLQNVTIINRWINMDEVENLFKGKRIIVLLPYLDATQSGVTSIAMLYHDLVIGTNSGGLSEQIQHKKTGLLAKPGDAEDLANKMIWAIEHKDECNSYIECAYKKAKKMTWANAAKKLLASLDNIS
ncbi:glycosyltransferase family 4 protein [Selenomonas sp. AE3005]|uniref:glycosyltransferase family 4 protein n=1 Tax=Selenomonas sp. AE3005 TaxID=1485543 RepID=UPI0004839D43|nr:glycosyltransferase family 4 protein [Selenomonas sp. AE3005]